LFTKYKDYIIREFSSFGFNVEFEERAEVKHSKIESAFIKANTFDQMILIEVPGKMMSDLRKNNLITIKLKVDTNSPAGFSTEMKYLFSPVQYAVRMYSTPSLFAGKMHAVMFRKWKTRVKGRDWYDFAWYVSNYPRLDLRHLEERIRQSGDYTDDSPLTKELFSEMLTGCIDKLDGGSAKAEVRQCL